MVLFKQKKKKRNTDEIAFYLLDNYVVTRPRGPYIKSYFEGLYSFDPETIKKLSDEWAVLAEFSIEWALFLGYGNSGTKKLILDSFLRIWDLFFSNFHGMLPFTSETLLKRVDHYFDSVRNTPIEALKEQPLSRYARELIARSVGKTFANAVGFKNDSGIIIKAEKDFEDRVNRLIAFLENYEISNTENRRWTHMALAGGVRPEDP